MDQRANDDLLRRITELETENTRLREGAERAEAAGAHGGLSQGVTTPFTPPTAATPAAPRPRRTWGWTLLAVVLITVGALVAPFAVVASWARVALSDTDRFVAAYAPLAEDPEVQEYVTGQAVTAINEQIDLPRLTADVIDGITQLGTGPAATQALELLKGPAATGLQSLVENGVTRFVQSDAFADVWATALRISHTQVVAVMGDDPNAAVTVDERGTIGIQLAPIIDAAKDALLTQGIGLASQIPTVDRTIVVAPVDALPTAQLAYAAVLSLGSWLPWIAILLLAAGVLAARRRSRALIWAAVALGASMLLTLAALAVGNVASLSAIDAAVVPPSVTALLYETVVGDMRNTAVSVLVLAIVVAVVAWLAGPFPTPRRLRGFARAGASSVRAAAESRGITTGRTGEWIYRWRTGLLVAVAVLAASIVLFSRPLTVGLTLWTLVLAALAVAILELVQRPVPAAAAGVGRTADAEQEQVDGRALHT
jgi:hypothetical protein